MISLFVIEKETQAIIPAVVTDASQSDLEQTEIDKWQTRWNTKYVKSLPNKVALKRKDNSELLGLMSYEIQESLLVVEILYFENAVHSNGNILHIDGSNKKYDGIARAMLAYAIDVSVNNGFDGVVTFKAKTTELLNYYIDNFGARPVSSRDPFQLIIWDDAANEILADYKE